MTPRWEVELSVLGRMVNFPELARQGLAQLDPGDFVAPQHRRLFQAVGNVLATGAPYIPSEIGRHLPEGDLPVLAHAMELGIDAGPAAAANLTQLCRVLADQRAVQDARAIGMRLADQADGDGVATAMAALRALQGRRDAPEPETLEAVIRGAVSEARPPAVETGIPSLDRLVRLEPCTLSVVAARPGVGKTAFLVGCGLDAAALGWDVVLVTIEMSAEELARRHCRGLKPGAAERLHLLRLDAPRVGEVAQAARRFATAHAHPVVLVDYLQLVRPDGTYKARWEAVGEVVRELKALAMSAEIPVVVAAQLSRATEQRAGKRPELSDLRESGETEQAADVVMLLHRNEAEAQLLIAKNRHGSVGLVPLTFAARDVRFYPRAVAW